MSLLLTAALLTVPAVKPSVIATRPALLSGGPSEVWSVAVSPDGKSMRVRNCSSGRLTPKR
jgi:hypothetical protein